MTKTEHDDLPLVTDPVEESPASPETSVSTVSTAAARRARPRAANGRRSY